MRKARLQKLPILIVWLFALAACDAGWRETGRVRAGRGDLRIFTATTEKSVPDVQRVGLNLGFATSWGAEQLNANVIKNPGFEGLIDRSLVIVKNAAPGTFTDNETYLGRPDGFWVGADFDVRSGRNAGRRGKIIGSQRRNAQNLPQFIVDDPNLELAAGDVVALTRIDDDGPPARWWVVPESADLIGVQNGVSAPNGAGKRCLVLTPKNGKTAAVSSYLDAITDRAGKMLPVNGFWTLSFWSRRETGSAQLTVSFGRKNSAPFVQKTIDPATDWTKTVIRFDARDDGPNGILELNFRTSAGDGQIFLDAVDLRAARDDGAFRSEAVENLRRLAPGYLRDWQGQLGDTIENRLADRFARRTVRVRPENLESSDFYYSIPEFLDLCRTVSANPWLIIPTTAGDDELYRLGQFLGSRDYDFSEIVLEFGNENWNSLFRVAGIADPIVHGQIADRAFARIREGAGQNLRLKLLVNAQHANPDAAADVLHGSARADGLSVAPYFLHNLDAGLSRLDALNEMFSGDNGKMARIADSTRAATKELSVYEVNLHTTGGSATRAERNAVTVGAAAGTALAKVLLENLSLGVRRQCVYTFTGFDAKGDDGKDSVRLWGIVRDLGQTQRFRPQGLATIMLNRAVRGDLIKMLAADDNDDVAVYGFRSGDDWRAAVVSTAPETRRVQIRFPVDHTRLGDFKLFLLNAPSATDTNEDTEAVKIIETRFETTNGNIDFEIPPFGFAVVLTGSDNL